MRFVIKRGLDIPISGKPQGSLQHCPEFSQIALNVGSFDQVRFRVLVKPGEKVKIGQPLLENKKFPGQFFVAPASGTLIEIRRGIKRRLLDLVIQVSDQEDVHTHSPLDLQKATREEIVQRLKEGGAFPHIHARPFNVIPDPSKIPRDIFVSAIHTAPFTPSAELQILGKEKLFQSGLTALSKLTPGNVHLIYKEDSSFDPFLNAKDCLLHTIKGPHPAGNPSVHIHLIQPIRQSSDLVWTLTAADVVIIGSLVETGRYPIEKIISVAGNGVRDGQQSYIRGRMGLPISSLSFNRLKEEPLFLISGNPLTGIKVEKTDFLGFFDSVFCAFPENVSRESFHFLRLGKEKYSATKAYLSGHLSPPPEGYSFTTNQHGEERPFIDGSVYQKVMPMKIPVMQLVKAILAEDSELAEFLGLFEVAGEDFALPSFICPSKIEMIDIVDQGLHRSALEMGIVT